MFVDGNLFGRGKQLVVGGRLADVDSGALLAYRDPALFGGWGYWQLQGNVQRQIIPEYNASFDFADTPLRETHLTSYGFETVFGIAWFRRLKTQISWGMQQYNVDRSDVPATDTTSEMPAAEGDPERDRRRRQGVAQLRFPRARVRGHDRHRADRVLRSRQPRASAAICGTGDPRSTSSAA